MANMQEYEEKKAKVLQFKKDNPELSTRTIAELTGISKSSVQNYLTAEKTNKQTSVTLDPQNISFSPAPSKKSEAPVQNEIPPFGLSETKAAVLVIGLVIAGGVGLGALSAYTVKWLSDNL